MYNIEDLFDKRSAVGTKLEQFLTEKAYTKAKLCEEAGVSRPTLDKLLAGTLTSKTNYEKHISKILNCLSLSPDVLLGNVQNEYNRTRAIRNMMKITSEEVSEKTGISLARLKEIESGEEAATAELRDLAWCLSTSVRSLSGTNFFDVQVAALDCPHAYRKKESEGISGFWGHIGILPTNQDTYLWFPITGDTRHAIYQTMEEQRIVVPCMNNKVLLINMENVKELILLDDACDEPGNTNWDPEVDCGGIPLVVYEAFDDYIAYCDGEEVPDHVLSPSFREALHSFCRQKNCSPDELYELIHTVAVYFNDGKIQYTDIDFQCSEQISQEIFHIYNFGESGISNNWLTYCDRNGAERMINMKNVSLLELPLVDVEEAICREQEEMFY